MYRYTVSLYWSYRRPKASASPAWARSTRSIMRALSLSAAGRRAGAAPVERPRLPTAAEPSARAEAGPIGAAGAARAGTAYAVGTKPRNRSRTVARSVARPEASTPTCGYTGLPEAELPSRAVRDRSPVVATEGVPDCV